jgi:hypothetical protein
LLAIEREDGRYDCYHSQWGAHEWRLATGGRPPDPAQQGEGATTPPETSPGDAAATGVDPDPLATDCTFEDVLATVDFQASEACYLVPAEGPVEPFHVCWFGFPGPATAGRRQGALVGVDPDAVQVDGARVAAWVAGTKGVLGTLVADGVVDPQSARRRLVDRLLAWTGDDRTVHLGPGEPTR